MNFVEFDITSLSQEKRDCLFFNCDPAMSDNETYLVLNMENMELLVSLGFDYLLLLPNKIRYIK